MHKVGVIGLGNIAAMYGDPANPTPYCHIGGIRKCDKVELAAVAELSAEATQRFRDRWGKCFPSLRYYDSSTAMLAKEKLDIVAICNRGPHHFETTKEVIAASPRAIFLEKPPSCSLWEMDIILGQAKAKNIPITVSYSRHWAPQILRMQELVKQGMIGEVKTVVGFVGHAFLSFASHVTDLICQFAGYCPQAVYARGKEGTGEVPKGYEPEPSLDAMIIEFANGVTGIQVGNDGEHGGFYAEVIGTKGLVRVGMYCPTAVYKKDQPPVDLSTLGMPPDTSVFKAAYDQIADHLAGGPLPHCTNDDFVAVNEIGFAGIESVITNKRIPLPCTYRHRSIYANG